MTLGMGKLVGSPIGREKVNRDIGLLRRPSSSHKHSLQAFYVYVHDDHTVKIKPLICSSFGADFDGDCVHIYYPQSLVRNRRNSPLTGKVLSGATQRQLLAVKQTSSRTNVRKEFAS